MDAHIALIGFGEAGEVFARAAEWKGARGFDILPERAAVMRQARVDACTSLRGVLDRASLVLSLVTADAALEVAREAAGLLAEGALFCDMNSVSPQTKRTAAKAVEAAGARYVDVAIMAPVMPQQLQVPLALSGPAASMAGSALTQAGFGNVKTVGEDVGRASAIKMLRSIMVKGIEALTWEMMAAARNAGVAEEVLASLDESERNLSWRERSAYNLERMASHGARRAAEMEEVARTLEELGIEPVMTRGTAERQRQAARALCQEQPA